MFRITLTLKTANSNITNISIFFQI